MQNRTPNRQHQYTTGLGFSLFCDLFDCSRIGRLLDEQQRLYDERAKLKKEAQIIDTMKANVDDFLKPNAEHDRDQQHSSQRE